MNDSGIEFVPKTGRAVATGRERTSDRMRTIRVLGAHVGYLMPNGAVILFSPVSESERHLIEVAAHQHCGTWPTVVEAPQVALREDE